MGQLAAKRGTFMRFDDMGTPHIRTSKHSVMKALMKHPKARLVRVALNANCKAAYGEWGLPYDCVRVVLSGGQALLQFAVPTEAEFQVEVMDKEGNGI